MDEYPHGTTDDKIIRTDISLADCLRVTHLGVHFLSDDIKAAVLGPVHVDCVDVLIGLSMYGELQKTVEIFPGYPVRATLKQGTAAILRLDELARLHANTIRLLESRPDLSPEFDELYGKAMAELDALGDDAGPVARSVEEQADAAAEAFADQAFADQADPE